MTPSYTVTSIPVEYSNPVVTGGTPPVVSTCTVGSMSTFPAGNTPVSCSAMDGIGRSAVCSFTVTVAVPPPPIPNLVGTRFLAFGDSLTQGNNGCNETYDPCPDPYVPTWVDVGYEYPKLLQDLLAARYRNQTPVVINRGLGGETAYTGARRIDQELDAFKPNALLLMEGVNDFFSGVESVQDVLDALYYDLQAAKARGITVFISTLTPVVCPADGRGQRCRDWGLKYVPDVNVGIRSMARAENVVLVDGYTAILADPLTFLSYDGLHLTRAGRQRLAEEFLNAIQANYEVAGTATTQQKRR